MDVATQAAVARALDASIAEVAEEEFARLSQGLSDQEIAEQILWALQALEGLKQNEMPTYDAWDALFYLTWYQPSHIAMAYTLARSIALSRNPLRTGKGRLQVVDFGCGALAMQFGLALASAETLRKLGKCPKIAILSADESEDMRLIGKKLWDRFVDEINDEEEYPGLEELRQVCAATKLGNHYGRRAATRWLTVLHVAYKENTEDVKSRLDKAISKWKPDVVVVTARPMAYEWAYRLDEPATYNKREEMLDRGDLSFCKGSLEVTTKFRRSLHELYREDIDREADSRSDKTISYFLSNAVWWNPDKFEGN